MIHGALTKSSKSWDIVTSDVATIEESRLEKSRPTNSLIGKTPSCSWTIVHLHYDEYHLTGPLYLMFAARHARLSGALALAVCFDRGDLAQGGVRIRKRRVVGHLVM